MNRTPGLRNRLCENCRMMTHHRTLYVKTEAGGTSSWFPIYWACTECKSLNPIILPCYRLVIVPAETPSALVNTIVDVLRAGSKDMFQLLAELRRRRNHAVRHVFNSDVMMAIEYLKSRGLVAEGHIDRTAQTIDALSARPYRSKHLGPCPAELEGRVEIKRLVSLYAQRLSAKDQEPGTHQMRLGPVGVLCLQCGYHNVSL